MRAARLACLLAATLARPSAAQTLARGDGLLAAGDTAGAIAAYEAAARQNGQRAEAHYRAGALYFALHERGAAVSAPRRRAEDHFRLAVRLDPDSAKYWLALAELYRTETEVTVRLQVSDLVNEALVRARRQGGPTLADAAYRAARVDWERYEQRAHRFRLEDWDDFDDDAFQHDWAYVEDLLDRRLRPEYGGTVEWHNTQEHLREALAADPGHVEAAGLLIVVLGEHDRWDSASAVAERLVAQRPDDGRAWSLLGLARARAGAPEPAEAAFDSALARLPPRDALPYHHVPLVLTEADSARWVGPGDQPDRALAMRHWVAADPMWLVPGNSVRTEFYARVTYADYRWGDPLGGYRGWEAIRGAVYVRYGRPDVEATLGPGEAAADNILVARPGRPLPEFPLRKRDPAEQLDRERVRHLWIYRDARRRYVFTTATGYARASFGGTARHAYGADRDRAPASFDQVPGVDVDSIHIVLARFRGDGPDETGLAVFGVFEPPVPEGASGAAMLGGDTVPSVAHADPLPAGARWRPWQLRAPPGTYVVRVEGIGASREWRARGTLPVALRRFPREGLDMSDVVVAEAVTPRDGAGERWTDFEIAPSTGRVRPGEPVALLWEVYNLRPDSTGVARYGVEVRLTVSEVERRGFAARILGGLGDAVGLSSEGDDRVTLRYERRVAAQRGGAVVEYLTVGLDNAPEATYTVTVTVTDRMTEQAVVGRARFRVTAGGTGG